MMERWDGKYRGDGTVGSPVTYKGKAYTGQLNDGRGVVHISNGLRHREDGPAVEEANGSKSWWVNGLRHRLDGPANEWPNVFKTWWVNGVRHRIDGPAVEEADGTKIWYVNDILHRLDGPAIERADGSKNWFVDGREVDIITILGYEPFVPLTENEQMILRLSI